MWKAYLSRPSRTHHQLSVPHFVEIFTFNLQTTTSKHSMCALFEWNVKIQHITSLFPCCFWLSNVVLIWGAFVTVHLFVRSNTNDTCFFLSFDFCFLSLITACLFLLQIIFLLYKEPLQYNSLCVFDLCLRSLKTCLCGFVETTARLSLALNKWKVNVFLFIFYCEQTNFRSTRIFRRLDVACNVLMLAIKRKKTF